jgi:hypothetical protein
LDAEAQAMMLDRMFDLFPLPKSHGETRRDMMVGFHDGASLAMVSIGGSSGPVVTGADLFRSLGATDSKTQFLVARFIGLATSEDIQWGRTPEYVQGFLMAMEMSDKYTGDVRRVVCNAVAMAKDVARDVAF